MKGIEEHRNFLLNIDPLALKDYQYSKARMELLDLIKQDVIQAIIDNLNKTGQWEHLIEDLIQKKSDPYTLCKKILERYLVGCQT